jgi:hypothetical protein
MAPRHCIAVIATGKNAKAVKTTIEVLASAKCTRATGHAHLAKLPLPSFRLSQKTINHCYAVIAIERKETNNYNNFHIL